VTKEIKPFPINGKEYYTPFQFAHVIGRSENMVYRLINRGNVFRKLRAISYMDRTLVLADEVQAFPFTGPGRYPERDVFHYDAAGNAVPCPLCSRDGDGACRKEPLNG
jgi:hypothetical protein